MKFYSFFIKKHVFIWVVKHLATQHYETGVMTSGQTDIVQIVEAHTELGLDKRIRWRFQLSSYTVRLETEDTSCYIVHIIAPTSHYRVALDGCAGHTSICEGSFVGFPGFSVGQFLTFPANTSTFANEGVFSYTTFILKIIYIFILFFINYLLIRYFIYIIIFYYY